MTNFQIYKKTLSFSLVKLVVDLAIVAILVGFTVAPLLIFKNYIAPLIGFVVAIIAVILLNIFVGNRLKAAQIAMMVKGATANELPDHTYSEGLKVVKKRFASITLFFMVTGAIRGTFRQLGRMINRIGTAIGGDVGGGITSVIDTVIQVMISYLCDCCLGWVFYREEVNAAKAACEGAAVFFKHGKTLARNLGRIFGMGLLSLLVIGGAIGGVTFLVLYSNPTWLDPIVSSATVDGEPVSATIVAAVIAIFAGIASWSILHSVFVRPFVLTGVLKNFIASGAKDIPTEADFDAVAGKSSKFRKLQEKI